ncbi:MAG TPA: D-alanyl-D-alanine carboxypeptidase, partial [Magnetospirillaceae bacterium]
TFSLLIAGSAAAFVGVSPAAARVHGSILVDNDTGKVMQATNADVQNHPASLTKMMTLYLLFDALEKGRVHLQDPMKVSMHAARQSPSKLGLNPGQTITVEQGILGLVTKSANDAAVVIGEYLGGSEPAFATQMTAKARELGMSRTVFRNASGLPIQGQWSTPRDMATLAKALIKNHAREYHYFATREFDFNGQVIATHNHVLVNYEGADGLKTGYIASSGFNLVTSAKRDGHRLIGVVFGGDSVRARDRQMMAMLDAGFVAERKGAPAVDMAKADPKADGTDDEAATQPMDEDDADDAQVSAVVKSMTNNAPSAMAAANVTNPAVDKTTTAADAQEAAQEGAGDVDEAPFGIQLGSFSLKAKALQLAKTTAQHLGDVVADGHADVAAMSKHHKTLYRSLVVGLEESDAQRACRALKHHHTACRVIRTSDVKLAAR